MVDVTREKYDEAVRHWAYAIEVDSGLQEITMGRVFGLADVLGISASRVVDDLQTVQAHIMYNRTAPENTRNGN